MQKTLGVEIDKVLVGLSAPLKMGVEAVQESSQRNGKGAVGIMVFPHITCAEVERLSHRVIGFFLNFDIFILYVLLGENVQDSSKKKKKNV